MGEMRRIIQSRLNRNASPLRHLTCNVGGAGMRMVKSATVDCHLASTTPLPPLPPPPMAEPEIVELEEGEGEREAGREKVV